MPDLRGKVAVVTGSNSGIGYEAAKGLVAKGAHVVLAVRNVGKGEEARQRMKAIYPTADIDLMQLDLSSQSHVREFATAFQERFRELHILVNNAGVMSPRFRTTVDGFELQFGTNHLGHFALTGLLLPSIIATRGARVITVSSGAHQGAEINFDNLHEKNGYRRWKSYGRSKLANLVFAYELQSRFSSAGVACISVACHPGFAASNISATALDTKYLWLAKLLRSTVNSFAQSTAMGALPTLFAATEPSLSGGEYIGPIGKSGMRGYPGIVRSTKTSHDNDLAKHLWTVSEKLTGIDYGALLSRV